MAATVSAWGKPGAWALDAEENESELLKQSEEDNSAAVGGGGGEEKADFPSLSAAASSKARKKKPQALSLQEFSAYSSPAKNKGLTHDELSALPTGPRERSAEELDRNKLGGGFRSYGGGGGGRDEQPRRQGSFNRDSGRESRADETDDWGANKKSPANSRFERRGERGSFGGGGGGDSQLQSRADGADNWASNKSFAAAPEARRYEKRGGFAAESGDGGGADSGNWGRRSGGAFDSLRERRGGGGGEGDSESWGSKREESGGGGGRPRLNLQPRTLPVNEDANAGGGVVKPKGSSPFGEARPREDVLREKAQDLKEIEEKLEAVNVDPAGAADGESAPKRSVWGRRETADPPPRFVHCSILDALMICV